MQIIHTTSFVNQTFASDAHIFSPYPVSRDTVNDLLFAQLVVEAKWLGDFPAFIVPWQDGIRDFTPLFEDVRLIYPESWDIIDKSKAFLLNSGMYQFCKPDDELFIHLKLPTAAEFRSLFENEMFVVAAVGHTE
ncbi:MAG: hypothetical protein OXT74_18435 [Candidatus Poribacteria bacterium]|nr:hypothetical protein [Candidatus Poribacteria bacterium]